MSTRALSKSANIVIGLVFLSLSPAFAYLEMSRVATFPGGLGGSLPCGEVLHDGHMALLGAIGLDDSEMVYEDTGANAYSVRRFKLRPPPGMAYPYAVGDWDGDGLTELVTSCEGVLDVWEAVATDSFPTHLVFADSTGSQYGIHYAQLCDLDRDGATNLLLARTGTEVWETRGDNQYVMTSYQMGGHWPYWTAAAADFDEDSLLEFAGAAFGGWVTSYECCGNDSYAQTCSIPRPPGQAWDQPTGCAAAFNMEGDGLTEFISVHAGYGPQDGLCLIRIFREPVHNEFVCVCTLCAPCAPYWGGYLVSADVDGDGRDEFALSTGYDVRLFKCTSPGQYQLETQVDKPDVWYVRLFDLNQDGRAELIFSTDSTYIYEDTNGLGVAEFTKLLAPHTVTVQPTIARLGAPVLFSGVPPGADIEVLGLDGRLVTRTRGVRQSNWTWNLRDQSGNLVPAGTYFAVIRSKGKTTSLKLCLVK